MKKGLSLPMQFIVMAALALIVLVVVLLFMMQGQSQIDVINAAEAVNICDSACFQDQTASRSTNIGGSCAYDPNLKFIQKRFVIKGEGEQGCLDLTSCKLSTSTGECIVNSDTLSIKATCVKACTSDGGSIKTSSVTGKVASTNLCKLVGFGLDCNAENYGESTSRYCRIGSNQFDSSK